MRELHNIVLRYFVTRFLFAGVRRGEERSRRAEAIYIGHNDGRTTDARTCSWKMRSRAAGRTIVDKNAFARERCRRAHLMRAGKNRGRDAKEMRFFAAVTALFALASRR